MNGSLLSLDVLHALAPDALVTGRVRRVLEGAHRALGPASGARSVYDRLASPLLEAAGRSLLLSGASAHLVVATLPDPDACVAATGWGQDLLQARHRSLSMLRWRPRWWIGTNGAEIRLVDNGHAFSKRFAGFTLDDAVNDDASAATLASVFGRDGSSLEALVTSSHAHRADVAASLQRGVEEALVQLVAALSSTRPHRQPVMDDALTVVYRVLFLLFAEARDLVPQWHPTYRRSYTIESLRPAVERGHPVRGLWASLQAISRLAHRGCHAGLLRMTPFNGRLFAPSGAPTIAQARLDDGRVREVLLALTTRPGRDRRMRISYADLGVEQLGAVYERVLDFAPVHNGRSIAFARTARRKNTGTFYTPRPMTEYLVRRTLAPLVVERTSDQILALKVLDPAMGSGAFLVAACRYLAEAYERALVAEGATARDGVSAADRAGFRRVVAQRCLYGVDLNPMAVQLARLSLWLCTLTSDRPLTFFDHHLRAGNSLVGASATDVARQPPGVGRARSAVTLPLFDQSDMTARVGATVTLRLPLALQSDDSLDDVREKERALATLDGANAPLATLRRTCDAWCAAWFWPAGVQPVSPAAWHAFADALAGEPGALPRTVLTQWDAAVREASSAARFFHWDLEFPEVFFDASGEPLADPGFDAVIGNPPWDTLRGDTGTADERRESRTEAKSLTAFVRGSGCYGSQGDGHANLYQAFAERMVRLTRAGGRAGLLMPSGLMTDHGSRHLRYLLLRGCEVDAMIGFDNREALFPIHRGVRFVLLTATRAGSTTSLPARFGTHTASVLEDIPDRGPVPGAVSLPLELVERFGGDELVVPELPHQQDRSLLAGILSRAPALGSPGGWQARFGRELNATDDRAHFGGAGLPVIEGKHLQPFRAHVPAEASRIDPSVAARRLGGRPFDRARLGYREVASATNRLTLIASMVPAGCVTTHTIFCAKDLPLAIQWFLCGVFNSFVANYLVRLRGGTHVPAATIHALPVPHPAGGDRRVSRIGALARSLWTRDTEPVAVALQVEVAAIYELTADELAHVANTFPLVPKSFRDAVCAAYRTRTDAI